MPRTGMSGCFQDTGFESRSSQLQKLSVSKHDQASESVGRLLVLLHPLPCFETMGNQDVQSTEGADLRAFMQALLADLQALESMIDNGQIESDVRRIGAEQEMFLVDADWKAARVGGQVLARLKDYPGSFTPELARFNLEANASPQVLATDCLSRMESELTSMVAAARTAAEQEGAHLLLCGILPTLHQSDLDMGAMVENPRYHLLNDVMSEMRDGKFQTLIKGLDELRVTHPNVMMEACNTSFQLHFQVAPSEFAGLYNLAQAITAPVLAASVNSPVLLQHRLWHETRVALFQQSLDVRNESQEKRGDRQRVTFGERWVKNSVLEILREDVARFRVLLSTNLGESSLDVLKRGDVPKLDALCLHNGTVYRWNRPCYGISDGRPHLRIENRVLPAGPTVLDEIASAAFFFGLMVGFGNENEDVTKVMDFDDAKSNFVAAARYGLDAQFRWLQGRVVNARSLILDELLPLARQGLVQKGIDGADIARYLDLFEERVVQGRTGSQWALSSLAAMDKSSTADERHRALTAAMHARQRSGEPVHTWPLAVLGGDLDWRKSFRTVGQVMTRDVFTLHPEDVIDLAASLMDWEHLHRVPVEDQSGRLVGLVTQRSLLRLLARGYGKPGSEPVAVREVMKENPMTASPDDTTLDAIERMQSNGIGCLPVVEDGRLVGIVTEHDFNVAAGRLLKASLRADTENLRAH